MPPSMETVERLYSDLAAAQHERDTAYQAVAFTQGQLDEARGKVEVARRALTSIYHTTCVHHDCFSEREHRKVAREALQEVRER